MENSNLLIEDKVAIIGAEISGLLCKKYLNELSIESDIYEEKEFLFGIWDKKEGITWDSMKADLSQYCCQFSDHFWKIQQPYLPTNEEVREYLREYVSKYKLDEGNIFFKSRIQKLSKVKETEAYILEIVDLKTSKITEKIYKRVIIASGLNSSYEIPKYKGFDKFKGESLHASQYKNPDDLKDKNVLIVGMSLSSVNISDEIASASHKKVFISCRVPAYIQPNEIVDSVSQKSSTFDSRLFKRRSDEYSTDMYIKTGIYDILWNYFAKPTIEKYSDIECLQIKKGQSLRLCFSNKLVDFVRQGQVVITTEISEFHEDNIVEFTDGRFEKVDAIIFCTGYYNNLKYLDDEIKRDIAYNYNDYLHPITNFRGIYQKNHKNLLFVGMHKGTFWAGLELQARYVSGLFAGIYNYPDEKVYEEVIAKEYLLKDSAEINKLKMKYMYMDYLDTIANDMGIRPDLKKIKEEDLELYNALMSIPVIAVCYRISKSDSNCESSKAYIKSIIGNF